MASTVLRCYTFVGEDVKSVLDEYSKDLIKLINEKWEFALPVSMCAHGQLLVIVQWMKKNYANREEAASENTDEKVSSSEGTISS